MAGVPNRLRSGLISPGFYPRWPPEYSQVNFAPRISVPVLIQTGKYDFLTSMEKGLEPLRDLFGTSPKDKRLMFYEGGHSIWWRMDRARDEFDFLDKYLGPAK